MSRSVAITWLRRVGSFVWRLLLGLLLGLGGLLVCRLGLAWLVEVWTADVALVTRVILTVVSGGVIAVGIAMILAAIRGRVPQWLETLLDAVDAVFDLHDGDGPSDSGFGGGGQFTGGGASGRF